MEAFLRWLLEPALRLAARGRVLVIQVAISALLLTVPFLFLFIRLFLDSARRWQRDKAKLTGPEGRAWLQDLISRWVSVMQTGAATG